MDEEIMPIEGVNSLCSKLKTPMEILEDLAKEYEEHEQLKYEIVPTDTGYFDVPVEYLCEVSVGAIKETASACNIQLAKLLAAQKVLDKVQQDGFVSLPEWKRVEGGDPALDPIYLLQLYCRNYNFDAPSYLHWKTKVDGKTVNSYRCFWYGNVTEARSESRYVAQALASVKMMDHVIDTSRRGRKCQNFVADPDDYVSVKPIMVAKMLAVSDKFDDFVPVPESFPVFSQKALRPGDPDDVTCRYGFKSPTSTDIRKPDFLVEYRVTFSGHSSDGRSAAENCISAAGRYAEKLAETIQEQTKSHHEVEKLKGL